MADCAALDPWIAVCLLSAGCCLGMLLIGLMAAARDLDPDHDKDRP